jgi:hypothetical protein
MTPQGRGRSPPSPERSGGEPPCGVDGTRRPRPEQRRQREGDVLRSGPEEEDASGHIGQPHRTKPAAKISARPLIALPPVLARSRRNTKDPPLSLVTSPRLHAEGVSELDRAPSRWKVAAARPASAEISRRHLDRADWDAEMAISRVVGLFTCRSRGSTPGPPWWNLSPLPCGDGKAASRRLPLLAQAKQGKKNWEDGNF